MQVKYGAALEPCKLNTVLRCHAEYSYTDIIIIIKLSFAEQFNDRGQLPVRRGGGVGYKIQNKRVEFVHGNFKISSCLRNRWTRGPPCRAVPSYHCTSAPCASHESGASTRLKNKFHSVTILKFALSKICALCRWHSWHRWHSCWHRWHRWYVPPLARYCGHTILWNNMYTSSIAIQTSQSLRLVAPGIAVQIPEATYFDSLCYEYCHQVPQRISFCSELCRQTRT